MSGLVKTLTLYVASVKVALRSIVILLASLLALVALVLASLPQELFSANDIPKISLAIVYGDGEESDAFVEDLNRGLSGINVVDEIKLLTPADAEEQLARGAVDAIITMPEDTLDVLVYGGHTTVSVRANDPVIGTAVYSLADKVIETLDELQNYALVFDEAAHEHLSNAKERDSALNSFSMTLIGEAFSRMSSVDTPQAASPFYAQALTLLLFMVVSIGSFFVAVVAARQYATGYIRHLFARGIRFRHLLLSQLMLSASIALVLGAVLGAIFSFVSSDLSFGVLLLSAVLLSVVLTAFYLMFSGFRQQPKAATTRTLLGCLALMFFLLFAGGGFYPTGLMQSDLRLFNPTWLSHQLSLWSLGGSLDPLQLALFAVPFALACAVCYFEWRRAL